MDPQGDADMEMHEHLEDDESRGKGVLRFTVENVSKLDEIALSKPYMIRNLPWKILVYPRLHRSQDKPASKYLGVFLQCNCGSESSSWSVYATAVFKVLRHNGEEALVKRIEHLFCNKEDDWGYAYLLDTKDISDPEKGFVKDDKLELEISVVAAVPHGLNWKKIFPKNKISPKEKSKNPEAPPTPETDGSPCSSNGGRSSETACRVCQLADQGSTAGGSIPRIPTQGSLGERATQSNPNLAPLGLPRASLLCLDRKVVTFEEDRGGPRAVDFDPSAPVYERFGELAAALAKPPVPNLSGQLMEEKAEEESDSVME